MTKIRCQSLNSLEPETKSLGSKMRGTANFIRRFRVIIFVLILLGFGVKVLAAIPSNLEPTSLSDTSFIVTWSTTDEAASTEILYGIGGTTNIATVSGTTKYHLIELNDLYPNTTYQYRIKSGSTIFPPESLSALSFTTLEQPTGQYLFSFAVLNDLRYPVTQSSTSGARGIPYDYAADIISAEVANINDHNIAFTIINGNIADDSETYTTQISSNLKNILENLEGAADLPSGTSYKYMPTTGYHDKRASYGTDWITNSFDPLTTDFGTIESRYTPLYGYNAASSAAGSVFNYQFSYNYYNFLMLDSVQNSGAGLADLNFLSNRLSEESNSKTFVFMNFPAYDISDIDGESDYPLDIPTEEVGVLKIANHAAFRSTIEAYNDTEGNPIVAAVISGHLGDNYKRDINNVSYVRQGPAVAFPTGYSIYKVYSNGYVKTFYKTTGRDSLDKPYYEHARDSLADQSGIAAEVFAQFWLGSNSMRNFTYTYSFIPGLSPSVLKVSPPSAESAVALNRPIQITFNKRMQDASNLTQWVTISDAQSNPVAVTSASFVDAGRTILKIQHAGLTTDKVYTVTVSGTNVKDEGLTALGTDYTYSFDTAGGVTDTIAPTASIIEFANDVTTDPYPTFVGSVSDESGVAGVEYMLDSGSWVTAEAIDGTFNTTIESFSFTLSSALSSGTHRIYLRLTDGAGNQSASILAYTFSVVDDKPTVSLTIDNNTVYVGDPISQTPTIDITVSSISSLESAWLSLGSTRTNLSMRVVGSNYYATHEVTTALTDGIYTLTIEAFDILSNATTYEVNQLYVQSQNLAMIQGVPLNYPNPFDPGTQSTTIGYTLSKPANVTVSIFDIAGNLLKKNTYLSSQAGGRAGYNEITWDGRSTSGDIVGTGIYVYLIIVDGKVVQNGTGKLTVFNQ